MTLFRVSVPDKVALYGDRFDIKRAVYVAIANGIPIEEINLDIIKYQGLRVNAQKVLEEIYEECVRLDDGRKQATNSK